MELLGIKSSIPISWKSFKGVLWFRHQTPCVKLLVSIFVPSTTHQNFLLWKFVSDVTSHCACRSFHFKTVVAPFSFSWVETNSFSSYQNISSCTNSTDNFFILKRSVRLFSDLLLTLSTRTLESSQVKSCRPHSLHGPSNWSLPPISGPVPSGQYGSPIWDRTPEIFQWRFKMITTSIVNKTPKTRSGTKRYRFVQRTESRDFLPVRTLSGSSGSEWRITPF